MKQGIFLKALAADATEAVIEVIGVIGWEVEYQKMRQLIKSIPDTVGKVFFDIYSLGGDVWEGNGIIQDIGAMKQETVARVQVAASMATLIAVACKSREISANGRFLIHNPWTQVAGDAASLEKRAKELRDCELEAAAFYAARTGQKVEKIIDLMAEERWLTPAETKELGFVQSINDPFNPAAYADVNAEIVAAGKWPQALANMPDSKAAEQFDCECIECGHTITSKTHCKDLKCEKCGGQMRRKKRPGPGQDTKEKAEEENEHDNANATGAASKGAPSVVQPVKPADEAVQAADAAGYARAQAEAEIERAKEIARFEQQMTARDLLVKQHQSAKDKAEARVLAIVAEYDAKLASLDKAIAEMKAQHAAELKDREKQAADALAESSRNIENIKQCLKDANERNVKLLGGGMAFEPKGPESWEEAMQSCNGDYVEAVRKYPKLRDEYIAKHKRN